MPGDTGPPAPRPDDPPPAPGAGGPATGADDGAPGQEGADGPATPVDDEGPVGANGPAILRAEIPRMVVEIDRQEGAEIPGGAVDRLTEALQRHAHKPEGIRRAGGNTFASDRRRWDAEAVRGVVTAHRRTRSGAGQVSLYVLALRGEFVEDGSATSAIGVSLNASVVLLFPDRWVGLVGDPGPVARAVMVHELGHVLGLVELTYDSRHDRQDPDHPHHSRNPESVMHWAVETDAVRQLLRGPPPDRFDAADLADIELIRRGG